MVAALKPLELFCEFFSRNHWPWMKAGDSVVQGMIKSDTCRWEWRVIADGDFLRLYSAVPVKVPRRRRQAVMEYLTRANWGMSVAVLELDLSDGEVVCRTTVPVRGLSRPGIEYLVHGNFSVINCYLPGLLSVIYGRVAPRRAIWKAEQTLAAPRAGDGEGAAAEASGPTVRPRLGFDPGTN